MHAPLMHVSQAPHAGMHGTGVVVVVVGAAVVVVVVDVVVVGAKVVVVVGAAVVVVVGAAVVVVVVGAAVVVVTRGHSSGVRQYCAQQMPSPPLHSRSWLTRMHCPW